MRAQKQFQAAMLGRLLALCASCAAFLLALFLSTATAATCPNEAVRSEQGPAALALPDCRAYELVSPGSTPSLSAESTLQFGGGKSSPDGNTVSYFSLYPATESQTSNRTWLSKRTAGGWSVKGLGPQMTTDPTPALECLPGIALSETLDAYILLAGGDIYSSGIPSPIGECGAPVEELVLGEPRGYANIYLRREEAPYVLVNAIPVGVTPANATYQAASADFSRILFSEEAQLTPDSQPGSNLFEWANGAIRLVGVLPNGEPVPAELAAGSSSWAGGGASERGLAAVSHAISDDGERVFFEANGNLYLRKNAGQASAADANCLTTSEAGLACSLQIDRSIGAGSDGGGVFQFASRDGSRVFFTSDHALTFPSSAQPGKPALYEYRVKTGKLVDLTLNSAGAANVRGLTGGSDDGSHLYFVARGVLTGSELNSQGEEAQVNQPNLYVVRDGKLTYVATLSPWEEGQKFAGRDRKVWWESQFGELETAWSPSGEYLLFPSFKSLTGFDNSPSAPGLCQQRFEPPCKELFLYSAETEVLSCVSCDPDGARPVAHTYLVEREEPKRQGPGPRSAPRAVLNSGQVFFETENPLSPRDVNGFQDVYEYRSGVLSLISSGTASGGSAFIDASADGHDVFFASPESLVRSDGDGGLPSVYDARVDGGLPEPQPPSEPCDRDETCRATGPTQPPTVVLPATAGFAGNGNVRPRRCRHGKVRRGGRCVKKAKRHNRKHRSGPRRHGRKS